MKRNEPNFRIQDSSVVINSSQRETLSSCWQIDSRKICKRIRLHPVKFFLLLVLFILLFQHSLIAQQPNPGNSLPLPRVSLDVDAARNPEDFSITLQLIFLMTILSLAPAILIMLTSFTRFIIVFHFIRQALGTQQIPPNQVLIGLALFMTFLVMSPTWEKVHDNALRPYLDHKITQQEAIEQAAQPVREFLMRHTREKDLALFVKLFSEEKPYSPQEVSTLTIIPAFIISELRLAFQVGFILMIPFLIIDMIVASVLMSMGMMMLPPMMISLPFKLLLFVLVDGWYLLTSTLMMSY
ncbi:MAG: flagellar biosynthetic protein FliP [Calditrichaeota bacterium]|nr:MAG: flagellar biosynthetic protein FliP [Calditrichota bacterium]